MKIFHPINTQPGNYRFNLLLDFLEAFYVPQEEPWFHDSFCRYMYYRLEGY